ncbi:MAG: FtsX-like permease family protein [Saccharofermentans sp.]|nr:FtsX-like permease family protein [Saccharofermentans sp.]
MTPYVKTTLRTIKMSLSRFIAILAIIALGVGFFAGLKMTTPSFYKTGRIFLSQTNMFDFRLISTIGFDDEDIEKLRQLEGVKACEGAVFQDAMVTMDDGKSVQTVRFMSLTDNVNTLKLIAGAMPKEPGEIVVDEYVFDDPGIIGRTITISEENDQSVRSSLPAGEYKIVGTVRSPLYLNFQRGSTDIGSGQISYYVYAALSDFDYEYYSEAYISFEHDLEAFSDEYDDWAGAKQEILEDELDAIIGARFDGILQDAYSELYDGIDEFEEERSDASAELDDARQELEDAHEELLDGANEIEDGRKELEDAEEQLRDARAQLKDAKSELTSAKVILDATAAQLESAQNELDANKVKLDEASGQIAQGRAQIEQGRDEIASNRSDLNTAIAQIQGAITSLDQGITQTQLAISGIEAQLQQDPQNAELSATLSTLQTQLATLQQQKADYQTKLTTAQQGLAAIDIAEDELDASEAQLNTAQTEYEAGLAEYNNYSAQLAQGRAEYEAGLAQYNDGLAEYNAGMQAYESGLAEYNEGKADLEEAEQTLAEGWEEYRDGLREYTEGCNEFSNEVSAAFRQNLVYAYQVLEDVERPETFVLGRDTNVGYVCFDNDATIVDGVAAVFPVFFFAIAALVCSTTMSRMVADERGQIGTMRALGYSETAITMKYVIYSGSAAVIGCVLGYIGGTKLFPWVIWEVYAMMYGFSDICFQNSAGMFILCFAISILCTAGVTIYTCITELRGMPADLIRPKAPAPGKRILLERIAFIWRKLKFLYKVSARNVFRFKKRMWMMIIGIAGCTSLLITAFGLYDSICNVVDDQYENILKYDLGAVFTSSYDEEDIRGAMDEAEEHFASDITYALIQAETVTNNGGGYVRDVDVFVSDDPEIDEIFGLTNNITGELMSWPEDGTVAINHILAQKNDIKPGDKITVFYGDDEVPVELTVGYIFTNYTYHYIMMTPETFKEAFGERFAPDQALAIVDEENLDPYDLSAYLASNYDLKTRFVTLDSRESFAGTMQRMNYVIVLVVACAACLAFIVLFNLNNINITERIREIATLKVMGFYRGEVGSYVMRENMVLVLLGYLAGIPLGIFLHQFVMKQIEMDMVTYNVRIATPSYFIALGFVLLFSVIVDLVMRRKTDAIDMAESLKSIE